MIFICNMGNRTRLRAPGQTRACEHYAMHVWPSCCKMSQEFTHHQIFPASAIRAVRRFLWLILLCALSLSCLTFFFSTFFSLSRAISPSHGRFLSSRVGILTLSCDVQGSHLNVIFSLRHFADVRAERKKKIVDLSVGNQRCILDLPPQVSLCLTLSLFISFRAKREGKQAMEALLERTFSLRLTFLNNGSFITCNLHLRVLVRTSIFVSYR